MALAAGAATGLTFHPTDALAFSQALRRLCQLHADPTLWTRMQKTAMKQPVGWEASSAAYAALYEGLTA
jgi:starch synthase